MGDGAPEAAWSTTTVAPHDAFDYWRDLICTTFVQLHASPVPGTPGGFRGDIEHVGAAELSLSTVTAGAQRVERTRSLIARSHEDHVLASIQLAGTGSVRQDGRTAGLRPGSFAFYDSSRPYQLRFDRPFGQLVVQVPRSVLTARRLRDATAVELGAAGPARPVGEFFVGLARQRCAPDHLAALAPHAVGLLDFALGLAGGGAGPEAADAAARERLHAAVVRAAPDPDASADRVAAACHVSRRTLFRILQERGETFSGLVRAERVRLARTLLRAEPSAPIPVVAARSGFGGEAQMYRAFRRVTGSTPAAWRDAGRPHS